jgi:hypothetical protein
MRIIEYLNFVFFIEAVVSLLYIFIEMHGLIFFRLYFGPYADQLLKFHV